VNNAKDSCEECSENWHQVKLFQWANGEILKKRDELLYLGAIPNGFRQIRVWSLCRYHDFGFKNGMPDIYFLLPRGRFHGLFIELKSMKKSARNSDN
jgi:hypothetical protein